MTDNTEALKAGLERLLVAIRKAGAGSRSRKPQPKPLWGRKPIILSFPIDYNKPKK